MIQTSVCFPAEERVDPEAMCKEIRNLRQTRDALVVQRQELDEKQHKVLPHIHISVRIFAYLKLNHYLCASIAARHLKQKT